MKIKLIEYIILGISFGLMLFGYWGTYTKSGNRQFDEMAGMIPIFLGFGLGLILLIGWLGFRVYKYFS